MILAEAQVTTWPEVVVYVAMLTFFTIVIGLAIKYNSGGRK